jgi:hypothetical protein
MEEQSIQAVIEVLTEKHGRELESPLTLFEQCRQEILSMPYEELRYLEEDGTPALEVYLYAMGPAKDFAISIINLLETGIRLLYISQDISSDHEALLTSVQSFLEEAKGIYAAMYAKFSSIDEAFAHFESMVAKFTN